MERAGDLLPQVPDVVGEVIAWRAWTVIAPYSAHPRLRSATAPGFLRDDDTLVKAVWPTNRWMLAECPFAGMASAGVNAPHDPPGEGCSCGLYAAKDLDHLLDYGYARWSRDAVTVIGQVGLVGKVIEGTQGWKAARGRIVRLYVPFSQAELAQKLSRAYNVPFEFAAWWALDPRLRARV